MANRPRPTTNKTPIALKRSRGRSAVWVGNRLNLSHGRTYDQLWDRLTRIMGVRSTLALDLCIQHLTDRRQANATPDPQSRNRTLRYQSNAVGVYQQLRATEEAAREAATVNMPYQDALAQAMERYLAAVPRDRHPLTGTRRPQRTVANYENWVASNVPQPPLELLTTAPVAEALNEVLRTTQEGLRGLVVEEEVLGPYVDPGHVGRAHLNLQTPQELHTVFFGTPTRPVIYDDWTEYLRAYPDGVTPGDTALPAPTRNLDRE